MWQTIEILAKEKVRPVHWAAKIRLGIRSISIPPNVAKALRADKETPSRIRFEEGERWVGFTNGNGVSRDLVFTQRNGQPSDRWKDWESGKVFRISRRARGSSP